MEVEATDRQTLLDIGLIYGGGVETAFDIAVANGLSVTAELKDGQPLKVPDTPGDGRMARTIVGRYALEHIEPATEASADERGACPYEGIGLMAVEVDFIVG